MLNRLHGSASLALEMSMQGVPSFETFSQAKLESFLSEPPVDRLSDYQKDEIRNARVDDRRKIYLEAMSALNTNNAYKDHRLLNNYLIKNRIFMTPELNEKFNASLKVLYSALISYGLGKGDDIKLVKTAYEEIGTVPSLINEITQAIQTRLHYGEAY